jgi:hypothetical protein
MRKLYLLLTLIIFSVPGFSQGNRVVVASGGDGSKLVVDGKDFIVIPSAPIIRTVYGINLTRLSNKR